VTRRTTSSTTAWELERVVHFDFESSVVCKEGCVHFGFFDRTGSHFVLAHQKHFLGLLGADCDLLWTVARTQVFKDTPNIAAELDFPMYIDRLLDGTMVVSNFGDSRLYRINPERMEASLFFDGSSVGMKHAGNCVVDREGFVWVNEVEGCKVWRLDPSGKPVLKLGSGHPSFQSDQVDFEDAVFNWIYDMRKGPDGRIYVLDSKNFAVRVVDIGTESVRTLAGTGRPGYTGDGGDPRHATFGSDPAARFDGPISMSLDEEGNIFVGDRFNNVVRMIDGAGNVIRTIAGDHSNKSEEPNSAKERDPFALRLPKISSMEYFNRRLFVPTDLANDTGDLVVLRKR
jgi:hypothetical protein